MGGTRKRSAEEAPNLEELLQLAITTAKQGNRQGSKVLLQQVLEKDKYNDRAWLWLAYVTTDPIDRRRYLRNTLRINPDNAAAKKALDKLEQSRARTDRRVMRYGIFALVLISLVLVGACVFVVAIG